MRSVCKSILTYSTLKDRASESGAVLVLFAVVIIPLVILLAFALDTSMVASSNTDKKRLADSVALGTLEQFLIAGSTTPSGLRAGTAPTYSAAVQSALDKAAAIGGMTANKMLGDRENMQIANAGELSESHNGVSGQVQFGHWWTAAPTDSTGAVDCSVFSSESTCSCTAGVLNEPCFDPNKEEDDDATKFAKTNAVRVRLWTRSGGGIKAMFAQVIGQDQMATQVQSTASLVARNGIFLIDLSRSMQFETHIPAERAPSLNSIYQGTYSETAFKLDGSLSCSSALPQRNPCADDPYYESANPAGWCNIERDYPAPTGTTSIPSQVYASLGHIDASGHVPRDYSVSPVPPPLSPTQHLWDDYECFSVNAGASGNESYLVDTFYYKDEAHPENSYRGPEPLMSILRAIRTVRDNILLSRAVVSDRIGMIGFDQDLSIPSRTIAPALPNDPTSPLVDVLDVLDPRDGEPNRQRDGWIRNFFFPRAGSYTDIPGALHRASVMLQALPNFKTAINYVALFSDGLANCQHASHNPANNSVTCSPYDWGLHTAAIYDSTGIISGQPYQGNLPPPGPDGQPYKTYKDLGISFNMFLIGNAVQPNNSLVSYDVDGDGSPDRCSRDIESRGNFDPNKSYVGWPYDSGLLETTDIIQMYANAASGVDAGQSPYTVPNREFYVNGVLPTKGIWAPLRPSCILPEQSKTFHPGSLAGSVPDGTVVTYDDCRNGVLEEDFDKFCKDRGRINKYVEAAPFTNFTLDPTPDPSDSAGSPPRLSCDPQCRSVEQQVVDALTQIYQQNPYILVQ